MNYSCLIAHFRVWPSRALSEKNERARHYYGGGLTRASRLAKATHGVSCQKCARIKLLKERCSPGLERTRARCTLNGETAHKRCGFGSGAYLFLSLSFCITTLGKCDWTRASVHSPSAIAVQQPAARALRFSNRRPGATSTRQV